MYRLAHQADWLVQDTEKLYIQVRNEKVFDEHVKSKRHMKRMKKEMGLCGSAK